MYGRTVSRCVDSVTPRPLRDAQTLARSFVTSWRVTFQPRATSHFETKSTAPLSAPVEESNARSSAASETTSVMRPKLASQVFLRPHMIASAVLVHPSTCCEPLAKSPRGQHAKC